MAASYPGGIKVFTVRVDGAGNIIFAIILNDVQDEINAIETGLINGIAHVLKPDSSANNRDIGATGARFRDLFLGRTIDIAQGTLTADAQALTAIGTWNAVAVAFTALKLNITDTASAAASLLVDLQVGGASKFKVSKAGLLTLASGVDLTAGAAARIGTTDAFDLLLKRAGVDKVTIGAASVTLVDPLVLPADPTTALQATTKQYVDAFVKKIDVETTQISVTNTLTETPVFVHTVPANTLAVGKALRFKMKGTVANNNLANDLTVRVKFGTLTIVTLTGQSNTPAGTLFNFDLDVLLVANAVDSERASAILVQPITTGGAAGALTDGGGGSVARAFSVASDFEVTVQWTTASVNNIFKRELAILELVP